MPAAERGGAVVAAVPLLDVDHGVGVHERPAGDAPALLAIENGDPDGEMGEVGQQDIDADPDGIMQDLPPPPPEPAPAARLRKPYLLRNCTTVAGMEHIVNNLIQDVHTFIPGWEDFFKKLKLFEQLLHIDDYRRRLYHTCFSGTDMDKKGKEALDNWPRGAVLYESRFKCILVFLKAFEPIRALLLVKWSAKHFMMKGECDNGDEAAVGKLKQADGRRLTG